ncbi:MAG: hypothetical protein AAF098_11635 [Pseudomonadota bacterium]
MPELESARVERSVLQKSESEDVSLYRPEWETSEVVLRLIDQLQTRGIDGNKLRPTIRDTCGITWQSAHSWFTGRTKVPRADLLARLAKAYDLDLFYILLGED